MPGAYSIKIYTALPGTPLVDEGRQIGTSAAGHMWYEVSDGTVSNSYGFAPKEHGASSGPGKGYNSDTTAYLNPAYARTIEITSEQYTKLKQYGEAAMDGDWRYFKGEYNGASNSCVDFTWGALKHAGFEIHRPQVAAHDGTAVTPEYRGPIESRFDGRLKPGHNKVDIQQIVAPVPGSPMNSEISNPPPNDRSLLQHLLSDNELGTPRQRETAQRFRDQLGDRLVQLGLSDDQVNTLAAAAAKEQTRFAGQGDVQAFLLSRDGRMVAMRQVYPPLREFDVGPALALGERSHWNEAAVLARPLSGDVPMAHGLPSLEQGAREVEALTVCRVIC
ncbi:MAG: hypothetical protein R3E94_03855 [Burkholderiaceae bacterium]